MNGMPFAILGFSLVSVFIAYCLYPASPPINKIDYRDFNKCYGIPPNKNHFTLQPSTTDILYKSTLPQSIIKFDNSPSSFIILSKHGTGKTKLRHHYFDSLSSKQYFKILLSNKQINPYLQRFMSDTSTFEQTDESHLNLIGWSQNEFAQLLLSSLVTQFVNTYEKENDHIPHMSMSDKIDLIIIICYYHDGPGITKLEDFVNSFLLKSADTIYSTGKITTIVDKQNKIGYNQLLTHFKRDLKKLSIVRKNTNKLELLFAIVKSEGFENMGIKKTMYDNIFSSLTSFTRFMKNYVKKPVVFVIDDIDENPYFFRENTVDQTSLELFYRSSVSQQILASLMAQNFYLSLFYPDIDEINIEDTIIRNDKLLVYKITWNTKVLIDYADYILEEINKQASATSRCKPLPDFKTLVNYDNTEISQMIDRIKTPKELHDFMNELIVEMNKYAVEVKEPFIATYDNVASALKRSVLLHEK